MIVTFEGGEGTGKTTCASLLCTHLEETGRAWVLLREPGGSTLSEEIRTLFLERDMGPMVELLLVLASRRQNIDQIVRPALDAGKIVVIDRFVDSTIVYQCLVGGLPVEEARSVMDLTGTWVEPDLTFVLDADPALTLERAGAATRFERRDVAYHERVRRAFLDLAVDRRHRVLDASRDLEEVAADMVALFEEAAAAPVSGHRGV